MTGPSPPAVRRPTRPGEAAGARLVRIVSPAVHLTDPGRSLWPLRSASIPREFPN